MPMLRSPGLAPKEPAICGMAVAIAVPSRFSKKNAPATRSAMASGRRAGGDILIFRAANYDAWATNDFFPSGGRLGERPLALYECLSACKSKGRNSAASGTNASLGSRFLESIMETDSGSKSAIFFHSALLRRCPQKRKMRSI
jgi:hypothetical protein